MRQKKGVKIKSFYCSEKGLFCKITKCAKKITVECVTERKLVISNQVGELSNCI